MSMAILPEARLKAKRLGAGFVFIAGRWPMRFDTVKEGDLQRIRPIAAGRPVLEAVTVPFLRGAVTGGAMGALVRTLARLWRYNDHDADLFGLAVGLGAFLVVFCWPRAGDPLEAGPNEAPGTSHGGRVVLLNPRGNGEPPTEADRLADFVKACELDTSTRRLEGLGYTRDEIERFRKYLIRTGWAKWNGADRRQGWALLGKAGDVLEALD